MARIHIVPLAALVVSLGLARAGETDLGAKAYGPYFEKNNSGLKGDNSHLVLTDRKDFGRIFGSGRVLDKKPDLIPDETFDAGKIVVAAIKRGDKIYTYKIDKVSLSDGKLTFRYTAEAKGAGGAARFASPLVAVVAKKGVKEVEFVENGKKVATVKVER
jgi:hypothetical protein